MNERNVFNDALSTFYVQSYGVGHMVKDYLDSDKKPAAATSRILFPIGLDYVLNVYIQNKLF